MKISQVNEALEQMREKIISLEWEPGMHLSSNQIASELGMSRTPIEKALILLEQYGLFTSTNGKLVVSSFDLNDIIELYQVKEAIETEAVKIILESGGLSDKQLQKLEETINNHSTAATNADNRAYFQEGMEFHRLLLEFAGNKRLILINETIRFQNERAQLLNILLPEQADSVSEHRELADALREQNMEAALRAASEHSRKTIERYRRILASPYFRRAVLEVSNLYQNSKI